MNDTQIRNAKKPGKLNDGKGLYIAVMPSGTKLWRYRYKVPVDGKWVEYLYMPLASNVKPPRSNPPRIQRSA